LFDRPLGTIGVVGADHLSDALAYGLRDLGATVTIADSAADLDAQVDALVWAAANSALGTPQPLVTLDADQWRALTEDPLREFVTFMQEAHRRLRDRGGRVVVLIPTIALTGAAGLTPWASVGDGQRALAKSAARVWGRDGITVNCVALPAALMASGEGAADISRPDLQESALSDPDVRSDVTSVVGSLCSPALGAVTGATIAVDGGRWMNP
jgi:3-oxoacyl-[acyl-carrier protein] reductase